MSSPISHLVAALILVAIALPSAAAANTKKADPAGDLHVFVDVAPIHVPVLRGDGRILHNVMVFISIEVANGEMAKQLRPVRPRLRNAMLRAVYGKPLGRADDPGQVDLARLRGWLLAAARRAAEGIEIKSVVIRQIQRDLR